MILQQVIKSEMQTGVAVVIIICVALVLLFLFYLVTRYFNYRLQKSLENQNEIYSMVEGIQANEEDLRNGEYEQFAQSRVRQYWEEQKKSLFLDMDGAQKLKQSLIDNEFSISDRQGYKSIFQNRPLQTMQQSSRSNGTRRSFDVERLSSYKQNDQNSLKSNSKQKKLRTGFTSNQIELKQINLINQKESRYKYTSQMVSYTNDQIFIFKNTVTSIFQSKITGKVIEKRYITKKKLYKQDVHFLDTLEAYGFEEGTPGAYQYQMSVTIPNFKEQTHFSLNQHKQSESKQQISLEQFYERVIPLEDI